ncbi:MAG TPA: BTAD domain-containing putative transcriptional regulator [Gemmatimonadales bacterium]|nr:BTAD domain-containing putative transcriptional regulator [Gemmatimonadales bacterium]
MIELRTLGAVDLRDDHGAELRGVLAHPKRVALLVYLTVAQPRGFQRRDVLLGLFWPNLNQQRARAALRKAIHVLRRALGADTLVGRGDEEVGLREGALRSDTAAFERAALEGRFGDALDLYRGEFLQGFFISDAPEFEHWVDGERSRLHEQAGRAAWALAERAALEQEDALTVTWARRAFAFTPSDEAELRHMVTLCYRVGNRAAALQAYTEFSARLLAEYGVRPSAETRNLIEAVKMSRDIRIAPPGERSPRPPSKRIP